MSRPIVEKKTKDSFSGFYKGYSIEIDRDKDTQTFYIQVYSDDGYLYDGWADDDITSIDDAIQEAIKGADL